MSYDLYLVHLPKGLTVNYRYSMTSPLITSECKDSKRTPDDRSELTYQDVKLVALKLEYQFYQAIMVACSTLLGVLIALLPKTFQPTEGRTLYLYCCFALALCSLLSGIVLYVVLTDLDCLATISDDARSTEDHQVAKEKRIRLRVYKWGIRLVLFFLLGVALGILFLFLSLMLVPNSEFLLLFTPYVPRAVLYAFVLTIVGVLLYFAYKLA